MLSLVLTRQPAASVRASYRLSAEDSADIELDAKIGRVGAIVTCVKRGLHYAHTALEEGHDDTDASFLGDQF